MLGSILELCAALLPLLPAQAPRDLDELLAPIRAEHRVPALAGAVLAGGRVTAIGAVGVRKEGCETVVTTGDRWHLGSCAKAMTATVVARLVERGALRWDGTVAEVFPELRESLHPGFRGVTVRQLLDHRAGLPADRSSGGLFARLTQAPESVRAQRLAVVERSLGRAPANAPGETYLYSNTGYLIAGALVERSTDGTWEDAIRAELFVPLGMSSAGFGPPGEAYEVKEPWGHVLNEAGSRPVDPANRTAAHPARYGPAGDVHASLRDWAAFVALHVHRGGEAAELLSDSTVATMHAPVGEARYACGFALHEDPRASGPVLAHHGSSAQWHAFVWASPADDLAVLVACNQGGEEASSACLAAAEALIQSSVDAGLVGERR